MPYKCIWVEEWGEDRWLKKERKSRKNLYDNLISINHNLILKSNKTKIKFIYIGLYRKNYIDRKQNNFYAFISIFFS